MRPPRLEERRTPEFAAELRERARAWIPSWSLDDGERDFGRALLDIAARFSSEVAERLDRAGDKMQRGFLDFLAMRGDAARPARMPVAFQLAGTATEALLATAPVQVQVDAAGVNVAFETETDVRLVPGRLEIVVGVDADGDAVFFPPPGLSDLEPLAPLPVRWELKVRAEAGTTTLQVDPEEGLAAGLILETDGQQHRIVKVDGELLTIDPPLASELPAHTLLRKVAAFGAFDGVTRDRQEHALYLGHAELLDIESAATIAVAGAEGLRQGVAWQYWGKVDPGEDAGWQPLALHETQQPDAVVLTKPKGAIVPREIKGIGSRWIRAFTRNLPPGQPPSQIDELSIRINPFPGDEPPSPEAEGLANITPLALDEEFFPLGREPRLFDTFSLGCKEAFSKPGAEVRVHFDVADRDFESLAGLPGQPTPQILAGVAADGALYLFGFNDSDLTLDSGPLRPSSPDGLVRLDPRPKYRAAVWTNDAEQLFVGVAAAGTVWRWERTAPGKGSWTSLGTVGPVDDPARPIAGIVHLTSGSEGLLFALREGKLFVCDLSTASRGWRRANSATQTALETIVPVLVDAAGNIGPGSVVGGMVGVDAEGVLSEITANDVRRPRFPGVALDVAPSAITTDRGLVMAAVGSDHRRLIDNTGAERPLAAIGVIGHSIAVFSVIAEVMTFALSVQTGPRSTALALWTLAPGPAPLPVIVDIPLGVGAAGGSPTLLPNAVIVPDRAKQVLVAVFVPDTGSVTSLRAPFPGPSDPVLSWEYANGTGWSKLDPVQDGTFNLTQGGTVTFTVPDDLRPMDQAGRTNHWIRAQLVGGDYGKEKITIDEGTVDRSTEDIHPPVIAKLTIAYRVVEGGKPLFVLAEDSGTIRDQSEANRIRGAVVESFVPLAVTLGRLAPPEPPRVPATGRALFIGFDAELSGAPVNVLLLVGKEADHERFAPMKIEALVADQFIPIVAEDTTRALGESGLLSMAFAVEPTPRELFGRENLKWLRLTPGGSEPVGTWNPVVRGAYLNAVFANSGETLTRELLGSSEGAPDLTVFLARPPVLRDTLELRVREPLGDEEREALRDRVLHDDALPGDWVLWEQVVDPGDEPAAARVYALDEATGAIRFGDGRHGAIPPIGADSIVAFRYRRTELGAAPGDDVPGNAVRARTALNLVTPLETVESVFSADQAAGGAPPESTERVLRFGTARMRHRRRAITAGDFEDLALESSPDVVQARCFTGRGRVQLVVVMHGKDPLPNAAEVRELRRLLLAAAPASLGAPQVFRITGPRLRRLRIVLALRVATLDHAGEVARAVQQRLEALLDPASWPLGADPKEEDVARAIVDTPRLEGLGDVALREVLAGGVERPWPNAVKRDELVLLDEDPLRLSFETVEVIP